MSLKLSNPRPQYDQREESQNRRALEAESRNTYKRNEDVVLGSNRLILTSPDGTQFSVTVDNGGTLSAVEV